MKRYCITIADRGDGIYQPEAVENEAGQFVTYEAANARIAELEALLGVCLHGVSCHSVHHDKKDRHRFEDACPVIERMRAALDKSRA